MSAPRLLIVKLSSLGDILHVLPTVHALRTGLGAAAVDWACQPEYVPLVQCFADVDRTIPVPRHGLAGVWRGTLAGIRRESYDMAIDLHGLFKSAWVARAARARRLIGPSYARELSWLAYGERAGRRDRSRHAAEQAMDVLDHLGLPRPASPAVPLRYPRANLPPAPLRIAFAPVSRWPTKNWPAEHFGQLARLLGGRGARVLVLGAPADHAVGEAICRLAPETAENHCGRHTIPELFGVLEQCDLLVANDTGPVHMAAALGRPCLVLFGPTRPGWTGPYGPGHQILSRGLPCQPCLARRCRRGDHACLAGLTPNDVFAAACAQLEGRPAACTQPVAQPARPPAPAPAPEGGAAWAVSS
jgi:ADP-heptose:LPS heptosyltransferase